jgi:thiol-disulfide isomerase/thioredoxin/Tfp pilus assembly protein PilF
LTLAALSAATFTTTSAQPSNAVDAARLRALYFQRDYETAVLEGASPAAAPSASQELKAWYLLSFVRRGREDEGVAMARRMVSAAPADGWSWLALAGTLNYQNSGAPEAVDAGARAFQLMPDHPDAVWIHAQTMGSDASRRAEAIAFIDNRVPRLKNPAELLNTKAYVLYVQSSGRTRDEAKFTEALATFEKARQADPSNVNAHYQPATYLSGNRRSDDALPLIQKALGIAPGVTAMHQAYWSAVNGSLKLSREDKTAMVQKDIDTFLAQHGSRPGVLFAVSSQLEETKQTERQRALEEQILAKFPDSTESEWVVVGRWRAIQQTADGLKSPQYRELLAGYLARPKHYHMGLLGEAYRNYFNVLVEDQAATAAELKPVLDGMVKYETTNLHITQGSALVRLADRKLLLDEAEQISRASPAAFKAKIESQRQFYETPGDYERSLNYQTAIGHDTLGWILFNQGRTAEAEGELLRSYDLNHESRGNLLHLGKWCEATGNITRAEQYYVKGMSVQAPGVNPCETALKALYEKRKGTLDGFDKYLVEIADVDRMRRKDKVLGERSATPAAAPAFALKSMDGSRVSLESLKGKIVVINFWGIWCGWCIQELPDYQKLHEKYKGDANVAILTIDNDRNPDDVAPWMAQKKYTFPVLFDDGFVARSGITAFPTTWFLDREGRRAFVKVGWSEKLLEEFSWRIEAIR